MLLVIVKVKNCWNLSEKELHKANKKAFNSWIDKKDILQISEYFP